ncbi:MAG TPA: hypothetical protein VMX58_05310 [Patescibacteria group bacterium]|nr:hypothetical protein [Patescibacteria group bacterium]
MRITGILIIVVLLCTAIGCSSIYKTEREYFTRPEVREEYIADHPGCRYGDQIRDGEIIRGMDIYEVIASWGLPNVYLVSKEEPKEFWIYYVQDGESKLVLIYTLTFDDACLEGWDIDQKRFDDYSIVSDMSIKTEPLGSVGSLRKKF